MYKELILLVVPTSCSLLGVCVVSDHKNIELPEMTASATVDTLLAEQPTPLVSPLESFDPVAADIFAGGLVEEHTQAENFQPALQRTNRVVALTVSNVNCHFEIELAYLDGNERLVNLSAQGSQADVRRQIESWPCDLQRQVLLSVL